MERWSSRLGFLLAATGAAVGLGNVWRFPAVVGRNGGGAYLVPYLVAVAALALPLMVLELAVGRSYRTDVVSAFRSVGDRYAPLGWIVVGVALLLLSYYLVLTGWVLAFTVSALRGDWIGFGAFVGGHRPVIYFAAAALATGGVVSLGVRDGIERLARYALPAVAVILVGLAVYAASLPGFGRAAAFLFTPDLGVLRDPFIWAAAFGQAFFSLSVGQGVMLTYGGYLDDETDLLRSSAAVAAMDVGVALAAGLVMFPIVFTVGAAPAGGTELAFVTLPAAFGSMPWGHPVGVAFFALLSVAALTSAVALLEVAVAAVMPATGLERRQATMGVTGVVVLLGLPSALSYSAVELELLGRPVLNVMDGSVGTYGLPVTAVAIAVVFAWRQPRADVAALLPWRGVRAVLRYLVPGVLVAVTALRLVGSVPGRPWSLLAVPRPGWRIALGATIAFLAVLALVGVALARRLRARDATGAEQR